MSTATTVWTDKVVLITGGASGIGRELATRLAAQGARLVRADVLMETCAALNAGARVPVSGEHVWGIALDVTDAAAVEAMAEQVFAKAGHVDGLVNCAGIYPVTPLLEMPVAEWDRVLDTNLRGPFVVTQAIAKRMVAQGRGGSVVNISSTASRLARPGVAHYGASKAGLNQLTAVMAVELAPHNIRVNALLPGVIGTEAVLATVNDPAFKAENATKLARIPMGRLGEPGEIAAMAMFLLSDEAGYCTGAQFTVDGGFTLGISKY